MIAKLAEGETPDIDPAECTSGNQSFSALITKALKEGNIDYQDPSALLKKKTRSDNARVKDENIFQYYGQTGKCPLTPGVLRL